MSEHLFVGGLADGRWIETQERERVRVTEQPKLTCGDHMVTVQEQTYKALKFKGSHQDWLVYAPLDWEADHVFTKLLREYYP